MVYVSWLTSSVPVWGGGGREPSKKSTLDEKSGIKNRCKHGFSKKNKTEIIPPILHTDPPTPCARVRMYASQKTTLVCIALSTRLAAGVLWLTGVYGAMDYFCEMWEVPWTN